MTHYHVDQMLAVRQILEYHFGFNDGLMKSSYTLDQAITSINHEFLHVEPEKHNIFQMNKPTTLSKNNHYLSVMSLKRLIGLENNGWLDDVFINFMTRVLNFYNFHDVDGNLILARHLFGNSFDFTSLIIPCHENNKFQYEALQKEWLKDKSSRSEKRFLELYKAWYKKDSKCQLWHMLQKYKLQEVMFESILVPFNISYIHWVNVQVIMPNK